MESRNQTNCKGQPRSQYCPKPQDLECSLCLCVGAVFLLAACSRKPDPNTLVMIIESSPTNLDPRVGVDAQSERIDELLFDSLLRRDDHFNLQPWLAESWEIPDPQTYIFHLRHGRALSQWAAADCARCKVDLRFAARRANPQR